MLAEAVATMRSLSPKPCPAPADFDAPVSQPLCPQCRTLLTDPTGQALCPGCGYSAGPRPPLLDAAESEQPLPAAPRRPSTLGVSEFLHVAGRMPEWLQSTVFGVVLVAGGAVAAHLILPGDCFGRALYTLLSVVLGLLALIGSTVWVARLVPAAEVRGWNSGRYSLAGLWRVAFRMLPQTS